MLLTKLKVASWAFGVVLLAGAGAAGVSYRAAAQDAPSRALRQAYPAQGDTLAARQKTRAAPDDLESLRLEVEALRRELRATRDLVKELQAEVRGRKGADERRENALDRLKKLESERPDGEKLRRLESLKLEGEALRRLDAVAREKAARDGLSRKDAPAPLAELEGAVRRLRKDPNDKQAAEALERALRRLKEQPEPPPGGLRKH